MSKFILIFFVLITNVFAEDKLPDTFLKDLNGKKVSVHDYLDGGPLLISFWFLACEPCKKEMKFLDEYHQKYSESGFKVLSINTDNSRTINRVKPFVKSKKYTFPILNDPKSLFFRKLGGKVCPYTVLVDHEGNIIKKHSGYNPGDEVKLEKEIKDMISLLNVAPKDTLIEVSKDSVKVIDTNLDEDPSIKKIEE
tara:strand:- start:520 stop:1104 length:585 start_codon:yes stop_codon:yes gene_type:complete